MNFKRLLHLFLFTVLLASASNAKDIEITGEATYYDDGRLSRKECEQRALEQARVNALANEFGTNVSQNMVTSDRIVRGKETNDFLATSMTEVRGIWLGDVGAPKYDYTYDKVHNLIVTCKVKIMARPLSNEMAEFDTAVLRNGTSRDSESTSFKDGDDMRLYFKGSTDGYTMVFLEDESRMVCQILPYPNSSKHEIKVKRNEEYIFFSKEKDSGNFGRVQEFEMRAPDFHEYNKIYVLFSPNPFSSPVMDQSEAIPMVSSNAFTKWILKLRSNDPKLAVKVINVDIEPSENW